MKLETHRLILLLIILLYLLVGGCTTVPQPGEVDQDKLTQAESLFEQKNYLAAADAFKSLAEQTVGAIRVQMLLRQVSALSRADMLGHARQLYRSLESELGDVEPSVKRLTEANLALAERKPEQVLALLEESMPADSSRIQFAEYHWLRADAYTMLGQRLESAGEFVRRGYYLTDPKSKEANQTAIWEALAGFTERDLQRLRVAPPPDVLSGWMELVRIAKIYQLRPAMLKQQLSIWRQNYPTHPVSDELLSGLLERKQEDVNYPDRIALLLPFSSRFARAAEAIRDGFLAAYYAHRPKPDQSVRIYDVGNDAARIEQTYQQAVADGAEFVVGPLDKTATDQLATLAELPVPTLALNYSNVENPTANLYQFGLSPEEEARQVAERTWLDGHVNAVVLVPSGPWGERVYRAFQTRWSSLGGKIVEAQTYNPSDNDFSRPIRSLLNIDESRARYRQLHTLLKRDLKYSPRRRQDIDFIFVAAYPRQARQIRPQLKFFHAASLPVYATSHVFTGNLNREKDRDMDGMIFGDMPWVLEESHSHSGLRADIEANISTVGKSLQRLYALGIDAFNIIAALNPLRRYSYERYDGETGSLSLDEKNRVHRQLTWVRFRSGMPTIADQSEP